MCCATSCVTELESCRAWTVHRLSRFSDQPAVGTPELVIIADCNLAPKLHTSSKPCNGKEMQNGLVVTGFGSQTVDPEA